ncbi:hypothetical protein HYP71_gp073 [Arthrobacter phage KBurrousTX]|uniref:Uncharacterized protein n=1 Tax=Arthrobacter phage KBurrousTX TaxID=2315608 RepID=A0A386K948_9CAUD|nr:hypothetical protein HYP71_gp073 [Arthrobacter phage KBurrousTX]AYD81567.1 hypothetical protein KBurrousTX_73 [Arthrobacter phage KBurrousTX]
MRTEPLPHEDKATFELAKDVFEVDNAASLFPATEWAEVPEANTAYAFGIAAGLIRRGYHKTPEDLVGVEEVRPIIGDLVDPDPCQRDMNGGCQTHLYLSLKPDDRCPQQVAKTWLQDHPEPVKTPGPGDLLCAGNCGRFIPWAYATKESGWKVTSATGPDTNDAGAHIRVWCPVCGPWGGQYIATH